MRKLNYCNFFIGEVEVVSMWEKFDHYHLLSGKIVVVYHLGGGKEVVKRW